jgi:hypothetical protein
MSENEAKTDLSFQISNVTPRPFTPDRIFDDETLKLGLYLAQDFGVVAGFRLDALRNNTGVNWFQVGDGAITMADPETEWDRVMARYKPSRATVPNTEIDEIEKAFPLQGEAESERIRPLGAGGQSSADSVMLHKSAHSGTF